jgi:small-conductance mechanosensitive channel
MNLAALLPSLVNDLIIWFDHTLGIGPKVQERLLASVIIVLVLYVLRKIILKIAWRRTTDIKTRYNWQKISSYIFAVLGLLLVSRVWFEGIESLTTYLGLVSAGIAIALKDLITGLAGWVFIIWRRPFEVGDRISLGKHAGDVIDIRLFQFTIMEIGNWVDADQSTGRVIHIPNGSVFTEPQINYTKGFKYIWDEMPVVVTFESDWQAARDILLDIVNERTEQVHGEAERSILEASRRFMIFYSTLSPTVYTSVVDIGVCLTLRYLVEPRNRRAQAQSLWENVLTVFAAHDDIDFAYPTTRLYNNAVEGKPGTRPERIYPGRDAGPAEE